MPAFCDCRGPYVGLILSPYESYRVCVTEWSREASIMRSHGPLGAVAPRKKFVCIYVCLYVCLYVCMHACMYVSLSVWMYVYVCI